MELGDNTMMSSVTVGVCRRRGYKHLLKSNGLFGKISENNRSKAMLFERERCSSNGVEEKTRSAVQKVLSELRHAVMVGHRVSPQSTIGRTMPRGIIDGNFSYLDPFRGNTVPLRSSDKSAFIYRPISFDSVDGVGSVDPFDVDSVDGRVPVFVYERQLMMNIATERYMCIVDDKPQFLDLKRDDLERFELKITNFIVGRKMMISIQAQSGDQYLSVANDRSVLVEKNPSQVEDCFTDRHCFEMTMLEGSCVCRSTVMEDGNQPPAGGWCLFDDRDLGQSTGLLHDVAVKKYEDGKKQNYWFKLYDADCL